jgi:hypothetical protein
MSTLRNASLTIALSVFDPISIEANPLHSSRGDGAFFNADFREGEID